MMDWSRKCFPVVAGWEARLVRVFRVLLGERVDDKLPVSHAKAICHKRKLDLVGRGRALAEDELAYSLWLVITGKR